MASFCATLQCAQQTSNGDYWDDALKTTTTASNGTGKAKTGDSHCYWAMGTKQGCSDGGGSHGNANYPSTQGKISGAPGLKDASPWQKVIVGGAAILMGGIVAAPICAAMPPECAGVAIEKMLSTQGDSPVSVSPKGAAKQGDKAGGKAAVVCRSFPAGDQSDIARLKSWRTLGT
ncbi:hypothetical protein J5Y04_16955 [Kitasatospora sp. RG8]|uniref:hypothetical protein n=1 Tax=Kitasatospora sp. RG8 TaxID=2820815 RepID=UPI001ADF7D4B|nr:hypothetical protein [Kitasatospora sp. RG8]MBP0451218.1 hypothetical protein [Kitasatospora sp. RG8]